MRISDFNKYLESLEVEDLQNELTILYNKFHNVKEYYALELGNNQERTKIYTKAKMEIKKKYATKSYRKPRKPRIRGINKVLTEMSKKTIFEHEMIDLYLFNTEQANEFIKTYDIFTTPIYNTIKNSFDTAIQLIAKSQLESENKTRCHNIVNNCTNYELRRYLKSNFNTAFEL